MLTPQVFVAFTVVLAFSYLTILCVASVAAALRAGGRREDTHDSYDALAASRLTMPVSVVVPAGTSLRINQAIHELLGLTYPEFEVVVIVDAPANVETLASEWQLESREFFYRRTLETEPVRRIFRSLRDSRLMVVEKDPGPRSDALNCGVNLSRYRFVAVVSPEVTFDRSALLGAMAPALRDPVSIVGVGSQIERVPTDRASASLEDRFQQLRSIRSLMFTRLFWGTLRRAVGPVDGVTIWRRDAVLQVNGFSGDVPDAELDMMFRLQQQVGGEDRRFVSNEDAFGQTGTLLGAEARAALRRRQAAAIRMIGASGPGAPRSVGFRGFAYFVEAELITPLAQCWIVLSMLGGAAAGWFTWIGAMLAVLLLSFGGAVVSAAALLLRGAHAGSPDRAELRTLLMVAPLEALVYSPVRAWSRLVGAVSSGSASRG